MQSIDLTQVIARRPFYKAKPRRISLWTTLVVSNAFWGALSLALVALVFTLTSAGKMAVENFMVQRAKLVEIESARAEAIAERDAKIANLLRFQSSSTSEILTMAKTLNTVFSTADNAAQERFFEQALPEALRIQITEGIPASAVMAQAIYESRYGQSSLAKYNNFFGLKAFDSWHGPRAKDMPTLDDGTTPVIADFRAYKSLSEGFDGYVSFLRETGRYDNAFSKKTGAEFIDAVIHDGYCGDPHYHNDIQRIIERHHLEKLDAIYAAQLVRGSAASKSLGANS